MAAKMRTIGRLSAQAGVKVTTIRYYESIGLMAVPDRSASGQRVYDDDAIERLSFIRHARELGFPVGSIRELIQLQTEPGNNCATVDGIARRHLADVRRRLSQLEALEGELKRMVTSCQGGEIAFCAVLSSLGDHQTCVSESHGKLASRWS